MMIVSYHIPQHRDSQGCAFGKSGYMSSSCIMMFDNVQMSMT